MYRSLNDALLLRAAVCTPEQADTWPDLTSPDAADSWPQWLSHTRQIPGFAAALQHASPDLARRVTAVLAGQATARDTRRVVLAVMRYLLRATTRATPYGLFAGIAAARVGASGDVRVGTAHRPVARIRMPWLAGVLTRLETDPTIRPHLWLRVNDLLVERGGELWLEHRASTSVTGAPQHVRVRATGAVRAAVTAAARPIRWTDLCAAVVTGCAAEPAAADRLITQLVQQHLLVTSLRPSMATTDPLAVLVTALQQLPAATPNPGQHTDSDGLRETLGRLAEQKHRHDTAANEVEAGAHRREIIATAATVDAEPAVGVDLRLNADVTVPPEVPAEACRAAAALTRLAVPALTGWAGWHRRFLERFGPYALVPVLDAVEPVLGLGYPAGFEGADPAPAPVVTDRDRALIALAQRAALTRQHEIVLDDRQLDALAPERPETVQNTTELTVRVHAHDLPDIREGRFTLSVVRVSRNAGTSTGRVMDLLDPADQGRMAAAYTAGTPPIVDRALIAQLAAPTRYAISMDVARAPLVLPFLIPVAECHTGDDPRRIPLDDIAVTADPARLYLISLSQRRPVQPVPMTAAAPDRQMLPVVRFLAEASTALATPCHPFEWGPAAHDLPFLPAVRYGRTVLSAARWRLTEDDLPTATASYDTWDHELSQWCETTGCPTAVSIGSGDQCLVIDLQLPAHRVLLRDYLTRHHVAVLRQAPDGAAWIGDRAHEIVIPLVTTTPPVPTPRLGAVVDVRRHGVLPGGPHTYLKVYASLDQQDRILTEHLPGLVDHVPGPWWFQRYHDPDPHLRLRLTDVDPARVHQWVRRLREQRLSGRAQVDTDFHEVSRFGGLDAYPAAEQVFAADSAAVQAQLTATARRDGPARQAMTAASMLDLATVLLDGPDNARHWLTEHVRTQRPAPARAVYDQAMQLAGPVRATLAAAPSGAAVLKCWQSRAAALAEYRKALHGAGIEAATLLPDLLHLHHTRVAGPDRAAEAVCLHLARAAALSWAARAGSRS
ncbi:lantibiotic dehydratase [Actinoplanes sichuanensis]|uniref:Lantibiotic dehydratase n=1 Tax=Actinoplanes sichuanensis TaxID=512349 RepID=A0ABW4AM76_9ACTN|nr:lantibiotic dehydratase [Actinoplanes sichuanensis]BEL10782.1 lantibiotic dehydratase [Actinoplanes sichuanensis]